MQLTRKEALDELLAFVNERGDAKARNLAELALNRAIEVVWQKANWSDYVAATPYQVTLVAGTRQYALSDYFGRLTTGPVRNLTMPGQLRFLPPTEFQAHFPQAGTSFETPGRPIAFTFDGVMPVSTQLAAAGGTLEAVSSSASDTTVRVTVVGLDGFGRETRVVKTLTGTTPVTFGDFLPPIVEFSKSYPEDEDPATEGTSSVGTVTLRTSLGVGLGNLLPDESSREYKVITFYPVPNVTDTIAIPYIRRPRRLLYDSDALPADWWPCLFEYLVLTWRNNQKEGNVPPQSWPALVDLMAHENMSAPRTITRPFGARR